jgi:hypothetical protein
VVYTYLDALQRRLGRVRLAHVVPEAVPLPAD